jgi:hypothetical protein
MKRKRKPNTSSFTPTDAFIKASVTELRNSFEIEGIFFTNDQIREMVDKVLREKAIPRS